MAKIKFNTLVKILNELVPIAARWADSKMSKATNSEKRNFVLTEIMGQLEERGIANMPSLETGILMVLQIYLWKKKMKVATTPDEG